ncbi:septum formation inhibitor Maf [Hoeflea sp. BAL378]|uniref:Maf-like protein n=1 Tax=Hoeflea sp. BAL378 TaxID=1547437 RepID=UPI00051433AF|nr:Maf-like protein [Hoeflea sp. BAL378]KGF69911.1 septum formation inhibitor Maf [Hoeflea sp. BAL378]
MASRLVLASASPFRKALLSNAGLSFDVEPANIDERAVEQTLDGMDAEDIALILAEAKAQNVSARTPGALVIGSDQTLSLDGEVLHKPADMEEARRRLLALSGRTHALNSAVVLARDGETLWRHVSIARLTMRDLDPGFIGRHLSNVGDAALSSVGAYQLEGEGIQLFDRVEGDYFTIVGLPLLPLLAELRALGAIDG